MSEPIPEFGGATFEELEMVRHESGRLLFPDVLRRRDEKGAIKETKVRIWVPNPNDHVEARTAARVWFAGQKALDPDRDKSVFEDMEQACLLARAIRTGEAPYGQYTTAQELAGYDESTLQDIQERINIYKSMLEVRTPVVDDETFWRAVLAIGRRNSLLPLADIAGRAQPSFAIRMAKEALLSPTGQSFVRSLESSTPAH